MIESVNLKKSFGKKLALDSLNLSIEKGSIYGLVGTNGGGKTTFMNLATGVYIPDEGAVFIEEDVVYDNPKLKQKIFYIPDDAYYFQNFNINQMANFYKNIYENWDENLYQKLTNSFPLDPKIKLKSYSKGMKRQAFIILGLSTSPEYLFLDEVFDGLDAVVRIAIRKIMADIVSEKQMTVVIASHNLRELEDFCDTVGLVHGGKLILQQGLDSMSCNYSKAQIAFEEIPDFSELLENKNILSVHQNGSFITVSSKLCSDDLEELMEKYNPKFSQFIPLSLEEVFISEMEAIGYDYNQIVL
ncbi:MAG: ABC transporter ATP-binding protein [Clostridia bacterium]